MSDPTTARARKLVSALVKAIRAYGDERAVRAEEDHRAAVEDLETYEARIRDIADHVLGILPADVPSIVLLDAIEREAGRRRIAQLQAEAAYLSCAEAIGVMVETDGQAPEPGPVEAVTRHIRVARTLADERHEAVERAERAERERDEHRDGRESLRRQVDTMFAVSDEQEAELVRLRATEAERDRLRDLLRECVHVHNGTHSEDCHAFGAGGDEEIDPEWTSPDPHCDCGALAKREAFRKAVRGEP